MAWLSAEKMLVSGGGLNIEVMLFSTKANPVPWEDFEASMKMFV